MVNIINSDQNRYVDEENYFYNGYVTLWRYSLKDGSFESYAYDRGYEMKNFAVWDGDIYYVRSNDEGFELWRQNIQTGEKTRILSREDIMAEYINMQQDEYDEIQTKLEALYEEILTGEKEIRRDIHLLIESGGGMYVQKISTKVNMLLAQMGTVMTTDMTDCFSMSEESITDFVEAVMETDVVSS